MSGSSAGRARRSLWAIVSFLFVLGLAVSTIMVHSERNEALDSVVERAHDEANLLTATLTRRQLTKPVTGPSYERLATKISRSVSSEGSITGVTVWSSRGRILFSSDESLVGSTPPEMRSLISGIARGSGSARVVDDTVQTFTPVSKSADGPVAIVELDTPSAVVEAQVGDLWSMLRVGSAFGLAVSLLFLGLTFFPSRTPVRSPEVDERPEHGERQEGDDGAEMKTGGRPEEPATEAAAPTFEEDLEEDLGTLQAHLDQAVEHDAFGGDLEPQGSVRGWYEEFQDEEFEDETHRDMTPEGDAEKYESMRQWREEFKARAKQAELRLQEVGAEFHEAPSAPDPER